MARLICVKYLHGLCEDPDPQKCSHHEPHGPSWTCNDSRVVCDDGTPTECRPILDETDGPVN